MISFPFALEQSLVSYLQVHISSSYPVKLGHTNSPTSSYDLPIIAVLCEDWTTEISGYGVYKADVKIDIVANAYDQNTYQEFDNADDQITNLLGDQDAIRSFTNTTSSGCYIAGMFFEGGHSTPGETGNDFKNTRVYSVFAQQLFPSSSVIYPLPS